MAGRGPQPKDPSRRARTNDPTAGFRIITAEPVAQPNLPAGDWPERTLQWWAMWGSSPLAAEFTATDWSELMDTALLHAAYWAGELKLAGELRLRVAKFGATPEDRARLRITFAAADQAEGKKQTTPVATSPHRTLRLAE